MKIYAGNLDFKITEDDLKEYFSECGEVQDVKLIKDFQTGRSKGFAFITFGSTDAFQVALEKNGTDLEGRPLKISEAKERQSGGDRGSFRR